MSNQIMKSYVHHGDKIFFVSTINRESSSMEPHTYAETMVWEWDPKTYERGAFVGQGGGSSDSIFEHQRICKGLFEEGTF